MLNIKINLIKSYLLLLTGSLIPLFMLTSFFYQLNVSQQITKLKSENKVVLNLIKKDLQDKFIDYINDACFLAETPQLRSLLYRKSNLKENQDYLEGYLKIKDKYIAGNIRNNRSHVIIERYHNNEYLKFSEQFLVHPIKKTTFTKLGKYKNDYIISISTPIFSKDQKILGSISLYGKESYLFSILKKYEALNLLSSDNFYWFSINKNQEINVDQKIDILKKGNIIPLNIKSGSLLNQNILFVFDTIDFKEFLPQLKFDKNTSSLWKLIIKIPEEEILLIKRDLFKRFFIFGSFLFLFISIALWAILQETNKRKFYENKLELQNQILKENNKTKDKFISILAHDLKGPFTGITGIFNILTRKYDSYDNAKKKKLIYSLNDSIQGINSLLINLLEWSKIQRGHVIYSPIKIKVNDLTSSAYQILKLNLETKNIKFSNNISDKHFLWVDKNMIEAVFRNIISNAIKFTPHSGKIELYSERQDKFILIYIRDNGIGMDLDIQI